MENHHFPQKLILTPPAKNIISALSGRSSGGFYWTQGSGPALATGLGGSLPMLEGGCGSATESGHASTEICQLHRGLVQLR